jgi:hypothetical protein
MTDINWKKILIKKASGEMEPFSQTKLKRSLERVQASPVSIEKVITHVEGELKNGLRKRLHFSRSFFNQYFFPINVCHILFRFQLVLQLFPPYLF